VQQTRIAPQGGAIHLPPELLELLDEAGVSADSLTDDQLEMLKIAVRQRENVRRFNEQEQGYLASFFKQMVGSNELEAVGVEDFESVFNTILAGDVAGGLQKMQALSLAFQTYIKADNGDWSDVRSAAQIALDVSVATRDACALSLQVIGEVTGNKALVSSAAMGVVVGDVLNVWAAVRYAPEKFPYQLLLERLFELLIDVVLPDSGSLKPGGDKKELLSNTLKAAQAPIARVMQNYRGGLYHDSKTGELKAEALVADICTKLVRVILDVALSTVGGEEGYLYHGSARGIGESVDRWSDFMESQYLKDSKG
jgi:hypothetical protein